MDHQRPAGASDELVEAMGTLSEALEWIERARGRLFDFHQMMGHGDALFGAAADALRSAGAPDAADLVRHEVVGRNVLDGRWTFQIVEEFDESYYETVRAIEARLRDDLMEGRRHVYEAELKDRRRSVGHPDHTRRPAGGG